MIQRLLCTFAALTFVVLSSAQIGGLRSPKTRLFSIETDTARIIFQSGQEARAERVLGLVQQMSLKYPFNGTDKLRKISILLQNATDVPNGYVGLAPWRSEFYLSAPANSFELGSMQWSDLLSMHEFRHVQQRSAARTGISKVAYWLMGEQAFSVFVNLSWPDWYTEGDAVIAETVLSSQGRGRLPYFLNGYREMILHSGRRWSYAKARNGSYKDYVPSQYNLGFLMMDYGRRIAGQEMWDSIALESARYKGLLYPFSAAVKRHTGLSTKEMFNSMLDYYNTEWKSELNEDPARNVYDGKKPKYTDESYPVFDNSGNLFFIENTFDHIEKIIRKTPTGESGKISLMGYTLDPVISTGGGKLCWAERRLHPRWIREDNTTIVVLDLNTGQRKTIAGGESFFSPALSTDGSKIAVVHDNDFQEYSVRIMNSTTGERIAVLPNPQGYYYTYPAWSADEKNIISSVRDSSGRMAVIAQDILTGNIALLTPWYSSPVGRVTISGKWIYFSTSSGITDQVFRVSDSGGEVHQLTDDNFSNYDPVVNPLTGDLYYTQFTLWGRRLKMLPAEEIREMRGQGPAAHVFQLESGETSIKAEEIDVVTEKYGLFKNPINVHSWNPFYDDPVLSLDILSENILSSVFWNSGFRYNINSGDYGPYSELTLSMWYPEILAGYSGWKRSATASDQTEYNWFQHDVFAGLRVPYRGVHGAYDYYASLESKYNYSTYTGDLDFNFSYLSSRFVARHQLKRAYQHPLSRFAQAVDVRLNNTIDTTSGLQFQVQTDFTFPGISPNHVLWLQADYRYEPEGSTIIFSDQFNYSRGYSAFRSQQVYRLGINYHFPLCYPDFGVAGIIYFRRIRLNVFFDYSQAEINDVRSEFNSTGVEAIFDLNLVNVQPFTIGLRYARLLDEDVNDPGLSNVFEVFLPVLRF